MATQVISFKQGTSYGFTGSYVQDSPSFPADLTGVTIQAAVRDTGYNYYPLIVTITSPTTFNVVYPNNTITWVVGSAYMDLQLSYGDGSVFYTETVLIDILPSITGTQFATNPTWG